MKKKRIKVWIVLILFMLTLLLGFFSGSAHAIDVPFTPYGIRPLLAEGLKKVGIPYVWGGRSDNGYDCSGLVKATFNAAGYTDIDGFGKIPVVTGYHGDNDASWKTLLDTKNEGDVIYFYGNAGCLAYMVTNKNSRYTDNMYIPEGSIIINKGHIRFSLGNIDTFDTNILRDYLYNTYGVQISTNPTAQNSPRITVLNQTNHNWCLEAYGCEDGSINKGVIVSNNNYGVLTSEHEIAAILIPIHQNITLTIQSQGANTKCVIPEVTYGIYADEGLTQQICTATTDINGYAQTQIPLGTYYIKTLGWKQAEYNYDSSVHKIILDGNKTVAVGNKERSITLSMEEYKDVQFGIYEYSASTADYRYITNIKFVNGCSQIGDYVDRYTKTSVEGMNALYYTPDNLGKFMIYGSNSKNEIIFKKEIIIDMLLNN